MGRRLTGTIERINNKYVIRVTLPDKTRPRFEMDANATYEEALAERDRLGKLAREGKIVRDEQPPTENETVEQYSRRWLEHRKRLGIKTVNDDFGALQNHILPVIGSLPIATVTAKELRLVVSRLDEKVSQNKITWKTARNIWSRCTTMFDEAVNSKQEKLRVLSVNPAIGVKAPDTGINRSKTYLYPNELLQLLECEKVSLDWRRVFALAVYTYCRAGELQALHWEDVDLERGVLNVHRAMDKDGTARETKTGITRRLPLEKPLLPLLKYLKSTAKSPLVIPRMPSRDYEAGALRDALKTAGVTRAELFADDKTRKQLTFHDLRATGITWCAVRGDEPLKIQRRAGHTDLETTQKYIREAENNVDSFGDVFPVLPSCLWESSKESSTKNLTTTQSVETKEDLVATPTGFEPVKLMSSEIVHSKSQHILTKESPSAVFDDFSEPALDDSRTIQALINRAVARGDIATAQALLEAIKTAKH